LNAARLWIIGGAAAIAGVILLAWFAGIQPKLVEAASAESQRLVAVDQNVQNVQTLSDLKKQYESIDELRDELANLQVAVPVDLDAGDLLQQVNLIAAANGVQVKEFALGEARRYGAPVPAPAAPAATPAAGSTGGAAATPTPTSAPTPAPAATAPVAPTAVTDPRITPDNFIAVPLKLTLAGPQTAVLSALESVQHGKRLVFINGVSLSPVDAGTVGPDAPYTAALSGYVYVLLDPAAAQASEPSTGTKG
jgi:hypothetical protein